MHSLYLAVFLVAWISMTPLPLSAQHAAPRGMDMPPQHHHKIKPEAALKPAQGASVKIITPKAGQVFKGDSVPLEFQLKKGKIGEHVHAYVDGEMAGMFKSAKGTLNGLKPGNIPSISGSRPAITTPS